jgi:hypothetical protein
MGNYSLKVQHFFADSQAGRNLRQATADNLLSVGITTEQSAEVMSGIEDGRHWTCTLLVLTITSKRPDEGRIAAQMKKEEGKS